MKLPSEEYQASLWLIRLTHDNSASNMRNLLAKLKENNVFVSLNESDLRIRFNSDKLPDGLLEELKLNKASLIEYLKRNTEDQQAGAVIELAEKQENYMLSPAQKQLWILSKFGAADRAYTIPGIHIFKGKLNVRALEMSFQILVQRHEILRTVFREDETGEVRQWIISTEESSFHLDNHDLRQEQNIPQKTQRLVKEAFDRSFDLEQGPLIRASLFRQEDDTYVFAYAMHHIISDGWSMQVLINELLQLYKSCVNNELNDLPALRIQYKDYACWQHKEISNTRSNHHRDYWLKQFSGDLPIIQVLGDKNRPKIKTYNGNTSRRTFSSDLTKSLKALGLNQGTTLYMNLLALTKVLLYKYTGSQDIIVGTTIAGREHPELEDQIGYYVNTLPLRTRFDEKDKFTDLLQNIKQVTLDAYEHQIYPFDELIAELHLPRDLSRSPLFDILVQLQNISVGNNEEVQLEGILALPYTDAERESSKFDLLFEFAESGDELSLSIEYNTDIYEAHTVQKMGMHLEHLLKIAVEHPGSTLNEMELLSESEKKSILEGSVHTAKEYPDGKTLVSLFEEQVRLCSEKTALVSDDAELTYSELNSRVNQMAHYLRSNYNLKNGDLAAIKLERDEWMIISILAVLKCGAAYVPIDPEYPEARIRYMLDDSKCSLIVDTDELDKFRKTTEIFPADNLLSAITDNDLAYVIYTSGSTGEPKGVMIEHKNVSAFIFWCLDEFRDSRFDTVLGVTSICFDLSVFEMFFTLCCGKKLRVLKSALFIPEYLNGEEAILLNTVPSVLGALISEGIDLSSVTVLNLAGEPIPERYMEDMKPDSREVRNLYGPTEDTTYSTVFRLKQGHPIRIGTPISNTTVYILDKTGHLVPRGTAGEIYISGDGLARGYLNKPELTKEKFIANPFRPGERMYKTGDWGRRLSDGNIDFIGRIDNQIKIRGYRIELGDIENALFRYEKIEDAIVLLSEEQGEKQLIAYLVTQEENLNVSELRRFLLGLLPAYMLPAQYIQLKNLPLTPNGKTDRKALPGIAGTKIEIGNTYQAPESETEKKLVDIWCSVLAKEKIGVLDNFFALGGHSLLAIKVLHKIKEVFHVQLDLIVFFQEPTVESIANEIQNIVWMKQAEEQSEVSDTITI
jgi:amino acid adenylation domain-containing protein